MGYWQPKHQFSKSLRDFLLKIPGVISGTPRRALSPPPAVPLTIRVGVAGPLRLQAEGELAPVISAILEALKRYSESANLRFLQRMSPQRRLPSQLRVVSQLAGGFDQFVAAAAIAAGYSLHAVLPGNREAFARDIERNSAHGSVERFDGLLKKAERVLELDREHESTVDAPFTLPDYSQAGSVILDHADLILVVVHDEASPAPGGSRWMAARAEERNLAVIEVPLEQPFSARLLWTVEGRREEQELFGDGSREAAAELFAAALDYRLVGADFDLAKTELGNWERRFVVQLDPRFNEQEWDRRWQLDSPEGAFAKCDLGVAQEQLDRGLKQAKIWSDVRASAMAELVRGSFIFSAMLSAAAVTGALLGIIVPAASETSDAAAGFSLNLSLSIGGKVVEIICLIAIFWLMRRSRQRDWRSHWLSLRQLERYIEQTFWLLLLGRSRVYETPSQLTKFQSDDVAKWTNAYFHALIRNCSFPTVRLTSDYLETVRSLVLRNLIANQINYLQDESRFQQKSDETLEWWTKALVAAAAGGTILFFLYLVVGEVMPVPKGDLGRVVSACGALLTATAAALSAIRSHGEYAQIAARYEGSWEALQGVQGRLAARQPERRRDDSRLRLRSARLASAVGEATDILIGEVQGWRAILQKKEIEPT